MLAQRPRTGLFDWGRLRVMNNPFKALGVYERPNTELMKMMVDMYPDDEDVRMYADRLKTKREHILQGGGEQYQEYDQKDYEPFAPDDYNGTTKIGRAYTHSILPYLPSKLLNTIYKDTHMQLDICSSFTTMLTQAFGECDMEVMPRLVLDPESVYADMGLGKKTAKKLINSIICSYPNVVEDPNVVDWDAMCRNEVVIGIKNDVGKWAEALRNRYPHFYEMVKNKCTGEGKVRHIDGTALCFMASDMEHSVMRCVINYLYPNHRAANVVWKYDGILIPKQVIHGKSKEQFIKDVEAHIKERLMLNVRFHLDYLHENSLGICIGEHEQETGDAYARWKGKFEKTFARVSVPPVYMMFSRGGKSWYDLKKADFEHVTMEQPKEFMKRWLDDPDKRMYKGRDFIPPPLVIDEGYLNLYRGIAAAELPPNDEPVNIDRYFEHVNRLVGMDPASATYLHKLIAQKIQLPGLKWRVMPIIMSAQGVGKDIWFDFLASVIGREQCIKDDGVHKFAGTNSHSLEGKLLCCFQEMGYKDTREHEEALKALITNDTIQLQKKYVNSFSVTNVVDFIGFTNQFNAINVSADDRRYFIVTADSTYAQDKDYMLPLLAFFHDDRNKRAVYDYYMGIDLEGFDSSADRPTTEAHAELVESNVSHADRFLQKSLPIWMQMCRDQDRNGPPSKWDFNMLENETLRISASIVVDHWMEYAKEMGMEKADKKASMIQYWGKQMRELNGRTDKYKTEGHKKLIDKTRTKACKFYLIDYRGLNAYMDKIFNQGEEDEPEPEVRGERTLHNAPPGSATKYVIKERGVVVFETDSLEEANKELGQAYVDTRLGDDGHYQVLVHPSGMETNLGREYMGPEGKIRLEMRFAYYRRDRTT